MKYLPGRFTRQKPRLQTLLYGRNCSFSPIFCPYSQEIIAKICQMCETGGQRQATARYLPASICNIHSVNEFLTYTVHCECPDPGSSIIQDDPLCQSVSNDGGYSSTSLRPCTTLTFPTSLPSRFLPRGRSTDNMAECSLNAGCYEVKVETFGDLTLSFTLTSWSTSKLYNSKSSKSIYHFKKSAVLVGKRVGVADKS